MTTTLLRAAAWIALAAILFVTVSPIGLRPHDVMPVDFDRALAFCSLTALFVMAYPRHSIAVGLAIVVGAIAIEWLQELSPTRHARFDDALVKACGALVGLFLGRLLLLGHARLRDNERGTGSNGRMIKPTARKPKAPAK
ncbi:VanZ family protein [Aureimonas phyllosphaerae]|nr:VanZ family protein [Aureimonas phyllosphaerae]MBB3959425.1 hypothetical protein [Aureimonas phyllosphaerae]SFF53149.1 hypothetical protein SAMN05216566_1239 [Aureimonas phyllosphaerae]